MFKILTCKFLLFSDDKVIIGEESTNTIKVVVTSPVATFSTASAKSAGQLVVSVSRILSPVTTPAQSYVAEPSSISVGSFYSTRAATRNAPRTVPRAASPAVLQIGEGKGKGGKRGKGPAARVPAAPAAASAAASFLSYDDANVGYPPQYPHPQFTPARPVGKKSLRVHSSRIAW